VRVVPRDRLPARARPQLHSSRDAAVRAEQRRFALYWVREITPTLFQLAAQRSAFLSAGGTLYIANDDIARLRGLAVNCLHAITDLVPGFMPITGTFNWGFEGSVRILDALDLVGWMLPTQAADMPVAAALAGTPAWVQPGE
jgi:hypothetical protein